MLNMLSVSGLWFPVLWHYIIWYVITNVWKKDVFSYSQSASMTMEATRSCETLVTTYQSTRYHKLEDDNWNWNPEISCNLQYLTTLRGEAKKDVVAVKLSICIYEVLFSNLGHINGYFNFVVRGFSQSILTIAKTTTWVGHEPSFQIISNVIISDQSNTGGYRVWDTMSVLKQTANHPREGGLRCSPQLFE
jgi:hypothetical protein